MRIKPRGKIYSLNEGYANKWDDAVREYVNSKKAGPVSSGVGVSWVRGERGELGGSEFGESGAFRVSPG